MAWGKAESVAGAVQQLVRLTSSGYRYFVADVIPSGKDARNVDAKLDAFYELSLSRDQRRRRRAMGRANVMHVRFGPLFVMMATPPFGAHRFYKREAAKIQDVCDVPIRLGGYTIKRVREGSRPIWHTGVRLEKERFEMMRADFVPHARSWSEERLLIAFSELELLWYKPVQHQVWKVFREVNSLRQDHRLPLLEWKALPLRRVCAVPLAA